jgi:penicillin-binding protein 1A
MQHALKDIPVVEPAIPDGVIQVGTDYFYAENPPGSGVRSLGLPTTGQEGGTPEEPKTQDEVKNQLF